MPSYSWHRGRDSAWGYFSLDSSLGAWWSICWSRYRWTHTPLWRGGASAVRCPDARLDASSRTQFKEPLYYYLCSCWTGVTLLSAHLLHDAIRNASSMWFCTFIPRKPCYCMVFLACLLLYLNILYTLYKSIKVKADHKNNYVLKSFGR